jgi:hypothetical protein
MLQHGVKIQRSRDYHCLHRQALWMLFIANFNLCTIERLWTRIKATWSDAKASENQLGM